MNEAAKVVTPDDARWAEAFGHVGTVGTGLAECSVGLQARPKPLWQTVHGLDLMSNRRSPLGLGRLPGAWRREGVPVGFQNPCAWSDLVLCPRS
jgi:hypothetical protein